MNGTAMLAKGSTVRGTLDFVRDARGADGLARVLATLDEHALLATLRERLAHYKVPKALEIVAELPRIGSGKVDRSALRSRAGETTR